MNLTILHISLRKNENASNIFCYWLHFSWDILWSSPTLLKSIFLGPFCLQLLEESNLVPIIPYDQIKPKRRIRIRCGSYVLLSFVSYYLTFIDWIIYIFLNYWRMCFMNLILAYYYSKFVYPLFNIKGRIYCQNLKKVYCLKPWKIFTLRHKFIKHRFFFETKFSSMNLLRYSFFFFLVKNICINT